MISEPALRCLRPPRPPAPSKTSFCSFLFRDLLPNRDFSQEKKTKNRSEREERKTPEGALASSQFFTRRRMRKRRRRCREEEEGSETKAIKIAICLTFLHAFQVSLSRAAAANDLSRDKRESKVEQTKETAKKQSCLAS